MLNEQYIAWKERGGAYSMHERVGVGFRCFLRSRRQAHELVIYIK